MISIMHILFEFDFNFKLVLNSYYLTFKDEAQTALFKGPVRTAQ